MSKRRTLRAATEPERSPEPDPTIANARSFNEWLQGRLKASGLTQRQLAHKTGVDHSTISRLARGDGVPSLHTAASLARVLGMSEGCGALEDLSFGTSCSPADGVEYALRSDESLTEAQVHELMGIYLAARTADSGPAAAAAGTTFGGPVLGVVHVVELRPRPRPR